MMLKKELADALGISGAMVSKLAKRGMPTDSLDRAQRWRRRHLEPGRVKGARLGTVAVAPYPASVKTASPRPPADQNPTPTNWLTLAAPDCVTVLTVEAMASACHQILTTSKRPDEAFYPMAFLRDLLRRTDPNEVCFRMPLGVWLHLVEHWIHAEVLQRLRQAESGEFLNATAFGLLVNPERPLSAFELLDAAADAEGVSVIGWPDDPDPDAE